MLAIAYRKLDELRENPNALKARAIRSQAQYGGNSQGIEKVQRLGVDERIIHPRASSPSNFEGDEIVRTLGHNLKKRRLNSCAVTKESRKDFAIADNLDGAIDEAGRRSEVAYQLAKQGNELKRDQEYNLVGVNNTGVAGNNTTIRETASLSAWIGTNVSHGTGGSSPGGGTAATDGTQRAMTEAMLKTVMQGAWTEGGSPNYLLVGPHVKTVVSGFAGIAEQRYMAPSDGPTTIIGAADVYVSDFGAISIVPSRFSRARDAYLIDKELVTLATLRPMQSQELAKTGKSCPLLAKALQDNSVNCLGTPNVKSRAISSQAWKQEGSTTIPSGSTAKRLEVQSTLLGEDIVSSLQKCKAALKECGNSLANCFEDLFSCFTRKLTDATKYMLLVEYGLQVNNEKGLGAVYDLSTS